MNKFYYIKNILLQNMSREFFLIKYPDKAIRNLSYISYKNGIVKIEYVRKLFDSNEKTWKNEAFEKNRFNWWSFSYQIPYYEILKDYLNYVKSNL